MVRRTDSDGLRRSRDQDQDQDDDSPPPALARLTTSRGSGGFSLRADDSGVIGAFLLTPPGFLLLIVGVLLIVLLVFLVMGA